MSGFPVPDLCPMRNTVILVLFLSAMAGKAQQSGFGLGIVIGEPTGISFKSWIGGNKAIDGAVAWSLRKPESFHLHADMLWHNFDLMSVSSGRLGLYYGVGGRIRFQNDPQLGIRIPVGLNYLFEGAPVDVFLEVVPILDLLPATDVEFNAALGARYFF